MWGIEIKVSDSCYMIVPRGQIEIRRISSIPPSVDVGTSPSGTPGVFLDPHRVQ